MHRRTAAGVTTTTQPEAVANRRPPRVANKNDANGTQTPGLARHTGAKQRRRRKPTNRRAWAPATHRHVPTMSRPKRPAPVAVPNPLQGLWRRVSTWRGRGHASPSVRLEAFDRTLVARFQGAYEGHARAALEVPADLVQPNAFADVAAQWKPGAAKNNSALQTTARSWDCAGASTSLYDRTSGEARNGDPSTYGPAGAGTRRRRRLKP